jgi:cytochrome c5
MASKRLLLCGLLSMSLVAGVARAARAGKHDEAAPAPLQQAMSNDDMRVEGEKRFRANCGRCHQSPHKFPPRMMFTIERHMRVRALTTEEDMRLIVRYLNQ